MMSANRQDEKDRLRGELESEIQGLVRKLHLLDEKISDLRELLREDGAEGVGG